MVDGGSERSDVVRPAHADRRSEVGRLHEDGGAEPVEHAGQPLVGDVGVAGRLVAALGEPGGAGDDLGLHLVHAERGAEDARAHVRDPGQLEEALHRAVLAHRAVQDRQHDDLLAGHRREDGGQRLERLADGVEPVGQLERTTGERGDAGLGVHPVAAAGDADGEDVVALGVRGPEHVRRRHARHLVLGRHATEQHHQAHTFG